MTKPDDAATRLAREMGADIPGPDEDEQPPEQEAATGSADGGPQGKDPEEKADMNALLHEAATGRIAERGA